MRTSALALAAIVAVSGCSQLPGSSLIRRGDDISEVDKEKLQTKVAFADHCLLSDPTYWEFDFKTPEEAVREALQDLSDEDLERLAEVARPDPDSEVEGQLEGGFGLATALGSIVFDFARSFVPKLAQGLTGAAGRAVQNAAKEKKLPVLNGQASTLLWKEQVTRIKVHDLAIASTTKNRFDERATIKVMFRDKYREANCVVLAVGHFGNVESGLPALGEAFTSKAAQFEDLGFNFAGDPPLYIEFAFRTSTDLNVARLVPAYVRYSSNIFRTGGPGERDLVLDFELFDRQTRPTSDAMPAEVQHRLVIEDLSPGTLLTGRDAENFASAWLNLNDFVTEGEATAGSGTDGQRMTAVKTLPAPGFKEITITFRTIETKSANVFLDEVGKALAGSASDVGTSVGTNIDAAREGN